MTIENGWGDWWQNPPEVMPGPSNPWAMKSGTGEGGSGGSKPVPDFNPPDPPQEGGFPDFKGDGDSTVGGHVMQALGVLAIAGGMFAAGVAAGAVGAGAATPVGWVIAAIVLVGIGVGLLIAGTLTEIGGIDPPLRDWDKRVQPVPARSFSAPVWMGPEEAEMVRNAYEMERLAIGQMDITDRAREAARQNDDKVYRMHLEDLWVVQNRMKHHSDKLAAGLEAFISNHADILESEKLPDQANIIEVAMDLRTERAVLADMGLTDSDLLLAQTAMRRPGPLNTAFQELLSARLKGAGGSLPGFLKELARDLADRDYVDKRAFSK